MSAQKMVTPTFSLSVRGKPTDMPLVEFLSQFSGVRIDSVFGFAEKCELYGGRPFVSPQLSHHDLDWISKSKVGFRIPIQNTVAGKDTYDRELGFLDKYHLKGNSLIVARRWLAERVKQDFPLYEVEASVVMKLDTVEKIENALELFDTVVPDPAWCAYTPEVIPEHLRSKVRLFANAGCMYTCPQRICYNAVSKVNLGVGEYRCSAAEGVTRQNKGSMYEFPVETYKSLGFSKFKLLTAVPDGSTGY